MYACLDGNSGLASLQEICRMSNEQLIKNVHNYSCFFVYIILQSLYAFPIVI